MELVGKTALVSGGSGDLGGAICRRLAAAGADVAVAYTGNEAGAKAVAAEVEALGRSASIVRLDQADAGSVDRAVAEAAQRHGRLDILVNNAAWNIGIPYKQLDHLTDEIWDRIFTTNVRGPWQLARAASKEMEKLGAGRIVNIASVAGLQGGGSSIAYATSKAALIHLTRCLAMAMAPRITVNCVAPGLMEGTRMAARLPPEVVAGAQKGAVLGRSTSIDDCASQVLTFCGSDSITGQVLVVDGGLHFH